MHSMKWALGFLNNLILNLQLDYDLSNFLRTHVSFNRLVHDINTTLHYLAKLRFHWLQNISLLWPDMVKCF